MFAVLTQVLESTRKLKLKKLVSEEADEKYRHPAKSLWEIQTFRTMQLHPKQDFQTKPFSTNRVTKLLNPFVSNPF